MPVTQTLLREPVVLVVHVNFAVAISMAQRLMEACLVTLAPTPLALASISRLDPCDVVVLCPYLTPAERELLLEACAALPVPPAVLEVYDRPDSDMPVVRVVSLPGDEDPSTQAVLTALTPTSTR